MDEEASGNAVICQGPNLGNCFANESRKVAAGNKPSTSARPVPVDGKGNSFISGPERVLSAF